MLGMITLAVIGIYVGLVILLPKVGHSPRSRLLIRLVVLSPVIWVVGNGLVGYAWFRVSCAREATVMLPDQKLPPARVLRLKGKVASPIDAEGFMKDYPSLQAIEAESRQYRTFPKRSYSRFERAPLTPKSRLNAPFELAETPVDVVGVVQGNYAILQEGASAADYVYEEVEVSRPIRQFVTHRRLMRPDGAVLASDAEIVYLWTDSSIVPLGAPSQDSSRCGNNNLVSWPRLLGLIAH